MGIEGIKPLKGATYYVGPMIDVEVTFNPTGFVDTICYWENDLPLVDVARKNFSNVAREWGKDHYAKYYTKMEKMSYLMTMYIGSF